MIERKTSIPENLLLFFRYLREKGFSIGPEVASDCLSALHEVDAFRDPDRLRQTMKAMLVKQFKESIQFDEHYRTFFKELEKAVDSKIVNNEESGGQAERSQPSGPSLNALKDWLFQHENESNEEQQLTQFSALESFGSKDIAAFSKTGLEDLSRLIRQLSKFLAQRESRRWTSTHHTKQLDIRKTIRQNLRTGTELVDLQYQKRQIDKLNIVLLCDVSRSMDLYSRFLVQFLYGFQQVFRRIETFVFSTRLYRITQELRYREFEEALQQLTESVPGWSGGTRIGESLDQFVKGYGSRMLDHKTVVMILSDGWDTGETEQLGQAMRLIQKRSAQVIWLNPLAGHPDFQPEVKGMVEAWPYIDVFAPVHNLESLRAILPHLRIGKRVKVYGRFWK
ncbi:MAG: VWA domain-containing protein [Bacteroidota bacterium]